MNNPDETGNDKWVSSNSEIENNQKHIDFDRLDQPDQTPAQFATKARKWVPLVVIIGIMALVGVLITSIFLVGLPRVPQQPLNIPTTNLDKSPTSTSGSTQLTVPLGLAVSISNGVTYVASQAGTIYAINEKNGSQIWQYREYPASDNSPMPYFEKPYVIDGLVYVCSDRGSESRLDVLQAKTGALLWQFTIPGRFLTQTLEPEEADQSEAGNVVTHPVKVVDGVVYISSYVSSNENYTFYALRRSDGVQLWHYGFATASIGPSSGVILFPSNDALHVIVKGFVFALRRENGSKIWSNSENQDIAFLTETNGIIYLYSESTEFALRASDGSVSWKYQFPANTSLQVITANALYFVQGNVVSAVITQDNSLLWKKILSGYSNFNNLEITDGVLYLFSNDNTIFALQAIDGHMLWHTNEGTTNWYVNNGIAYLSTLSDYPGVNSSVSAIRLSDGSQIWRFPHAYNTSDIRVADGLVLCWGENGLFALRESDGSLAWYDHVLNGEKDGEFLNIADGIIFVTGPLQDRVTALRLVNGSILWSYPTGPS